MKAFSLQKIIHHIFSFLVSVILLAGCSYTSTTPTIPGANLLPDEQAVNDFINTLDQKTTFLITDAPSNDYKSVMVDIQSPLVVIQNGREILVPLPDNQPIRANLLELEAMADHLADYDLHKGKITKVKLTLDKPEITLLDDTVIDETGINLVDPVMVVENTDIDVDPDAGDVVEIDVDVENSISIDVTGNGRPIFHPRGDVRKVRTDVVDGDEREARRVSGEIIKIPVSEAHPKSFLLKVHGQRRLIPVDVSRAEIFDGENKATSTFEALKKGQKVGVSGVWAKRGFLKAKKIVILPEDHLAMRGVIRNLNLGENTFDLVFLNHRDRDITATTTATSTDVAPLADIATSTDVTINTEVSLTATSTATTTVATTTKITSVKVHIMDSTKILLDDPRDHARELGMEDLSDGQIVIVHGRKDTEHRLIHAGVIAIQPENFKAFVAETNCPEKWIRVVKPFAHLHRLALAGIELKPHNSVIVEFNDMTKLVGLGGSQLTCETLERGMAVRIFGLITPHTPDTDPNPIRFLAFGIHELPAEHGRVAGTVKSVAEDGMSFVLNVDKNTAGFGTIATTTITTVAAPCVAREGVDCDHFGLEVLVSQHTHYGAGIATSTGNGVTPDLKGKQVQAAGFFHMPKDAKEPHLHALRVKCVVDGCVAPTS